MTPKKMPKAMKEIEDTGYLIDFLLASGLEFEGLCACIDPWCQTCIYNDQQFFSEKKVREAREWHGN